MKVSIVHVDTCLPGYWSGDHRPHVQVPAFPMSFKALRAELRSEIAQGAVAGSDDNARLLSYNYVTDKKLADMLTRKVYAAINRDIRPARKGDKLCFRDLVPGAQSDEECYAFFVILVDD